MFRCDQVWPKWQLPMSPLVTRCNQSDNISPQVNRCHFPLVCHLLSNSTLSYNTVRPAPHTCLIVIEDLSLAQILKNRHANRQTNLDRPNGWAILNHNQTCRRGFRGKTSSANRLANHQKSIHSLNFVGWSCSYRRDGASEIPASQPVRQFGCRRQPNKQDMAWSIISLNLD